MTEHNRPLLGITIGDSSGVGPEILLKAWQSGEVPYPVVVFGDISVLEYCRDLLGYRAELHRIRRLSERVEGRLNVLDLGLMTATKIRVGQASRASGEAARRYVVAAAEAAIGRSIDAVVTLPMNKEAARLSDPEFVGHTELIAGLCGVTNFAMMLTLPSLATTYVSTHVSVAEAVKLVRRERVADLILLTNAALKRLMERPRIAVAGLNPHAGEGGMFGEEETREIRPAVEEARLRGVLVEGPLPPDTVFYQALRLGRFDAIVCMYHDQGHIPLKTLDFEGGVNVTLGLPIIRTSVDHGTAFEIAYKGKASTRSFVAALEYGAKLAGVRR